jgi:hypothetical protein
MLIWQFLDSHLGVPRIVTIWMQPSIGGIIKNIIRKKVVFPFKYGVRASLVSLKLVHG